MEGYQMVTRIKAATLMEDFNLYPRSEVDGAHVAKIVLALEAGEKLPPVIVDEKSHRIVDGFHRTRAVLRHFGDGADIEADLRKWPSEKDMYLDAVRLNARHGKGITGAEQTGAILKAQMFKIEPRAIASSLGITVARVETILSTRVGKIRVGSLSTGKQVPLKRSIGHMAGKTLTLEQAEANDMLPGQDQVLLIRQLVALIENGLLDTESKQVMEQIARLRNALKEIKN